MNSKKMLILGGFLNEGEGYYQTLLLHKNSFTFFFQIESNRFGFILMWSAILLLYPYKYSSIVISYKKYNKTNVKNSAQHKIVRPLRHSYSI